MKQRYSSLRLLTADEVAGHMAGIRLGSSVKERTPFGISVRQLCHKRPFTGECGSTIQGCPERVTAPKILDSIELFSWSQVLLMLVQ